MTDQVGQYVLQLGVITAASMGMAEVFPIPKLGTPGKNRKPLTAWLYAFALGYAGTFVGLVQLPAQADTWFLQLVGLAILATVATGTAMLAHRGGAAGLSWLRGRTGQ